MPDPRIAMILYTVREPARENLADTLKRVRDTGFEYVQWSGMPDLPAEEIRAHLDAAGLRAVAGHGSVEAFERDFDGACAFWKTLGVTDVAPGGMMADCRDSLDAWEEGAQRLESVGTRLRAAGMRLSYHNHDFELAAFPGDARSKLEILYDETSPDGLFAELDLAWLHIGGGDPAAWLRRCAGRCPVIHAKDTSGKDAEGHVRFTALGQGVLDWDGILAAARAAGVEWLVYEQDNHEGDLFENIRTSYEFLTQAV